MGLEVSKALDMVWRRKSQVDSENRQLEIPGSEARDTPHAAWVEEPQLGVVFELEDPRACVGKSRLENLGLVASPPKAAQLQNFTQADPVV